MGHNPLDMELVFGLGKTALETGAGFLSGQTGADAAKTNALLEEQRAADATRRGEEEAKIYGRDLRRAIEAKSAAAGASGLDTSFGSPAENLSGLMELGGQDLATIRYNASQEALGHTAQAAGLRSEESLMRGGSYNHLLKGLLSGGMQWYKWEREQLKPKPAAPNPTG